MKVRMWAATAAIWLSQSTWAQTGQSPTLDVTKRPMPSRPDARMVLTIPAAISDSDIVRYGELLNLAAPQQLFLERLHARYVDAVQTTLKAELPSCEELNANACAIMQRDGLSWATLAANNAFYDAQDKIIAKIEALDANLFDELASILAPLQLNDLPRVRNHRARAKCLNLGYRIIRVSRCDLSAWLEEMIVNDRAELQNVDDVLQEYEGKLTPLTVELEREICRQDRELPRLLVWRDRDEQDQPLSPELNRARSIEALERQKSILAPGVRLQEQIKALNDSTLKVLEIRLPATYAPAINARYFIAGYPAVFPDQVGDALPICDRIDREVTLTDDQRAALGPMAEAYRRDLDSISKDMIAECDRWQDYFARTRFTMDKYEPYRQHMRELRAKRWRRTQSFLQQANSIMPVESLEALDEYSPPLADRIKNALGAADDPQDRYPGIGS